MCLGLPSRGRKILPTHPSEKRTPSKAPIRRHSTSHSVPHYRSTIKIIWQWLLAVRNFNFSQAHPCLTSVYPKIYIQIPRAGPRTPHAIKAGYQGENQPSAMVTSHPISHGKSDPQQWPSPPPSSGLGEGCQAEDQWALQLKFIPKNPTYKTEMAYT